MTVTFNKGLRSGRLSGKNVDAILVAYGTWVTKQSSMGELEKLNAKIMSKITDNKL